MILAAPTQGLGGIEPTLPWRDVWQVEWDVAQPIHATNLLDQVDLAGRVKPTPERHRAIPPVTGFGWFVAKARENAFGLPRLNHHAEDLG